MGVHDGVPDEDDTKSPLLSRDASPTDTAYLMSIRIADAMSPPMSPTRTSSSSTRATTADLFKSKTPPSSPRKLSPLAYLRRVRNLRGWMVCLAGFIIDIPFFGIVMSFGELMPYILETYHQDKTASVSWVGSLAFGLAYVCNPISTRLYMRFGCRPCALFAVGLGSFSLLVSSFVRDFWWMILTYSIMFGFSCNLTYNTPLILTGAWFPDRHHVLATCFLVAGIPFGSLTMNPVVESLVGAVGLRNTLRVLSALTVVIGLPCCAVFKQPVYDDEYDDDDGIDDLIMEECDENVDTVIVRRNDEGKEEAAAEVDDTVSESGWLADMIRREKDPPRKCCISCQTELWLDPIFLIFMVAQLIKGIGYVFPFIHLVNYMLSIGIEPATASLVMTIKGASDMVGRMAAGVFGERLPFPLVHVFVICCGIMGVVTYIVTFAKGTALLVFYAVCIGFFNGIYNALIFPLNTSLIRKDLRRTSWSYCQVPPGIAIIVGPTLAGAIYDATLSYNNDFYVNTYVFLLAMVIFTTIPIIHLKRKIQEKRSREGAPHGLGGGRNIIEMTKLFMRGGMDSDSYGTARDNGGEERSDR
ncbi:monocarboxylate transporter 13-like [Diadema setosum]|uniref:monocarboxylate transporter 13-like n=1 Tax=Diadema setosum TaxID=31175 RepID=UPI003B3BC2F7